MMDIRGAGGGGGDSPRTPVISPDSLHSIAYFRILDLVSEGEIMGLVNGKQSIYFDGTPLANANGSLNFMNVFVDSRTGTQTQDYIKGFSSVENATAVGVELKSSSPWVKALTNLQLSAVSITLSVPSLSAQNISNGDVTGYTINYIIDVQTDSGAWKTVVSTAFTGKTTSKYQRTHRIDLPTATQGWQVRVTRTTANANNTTVSDTTTIDLYTEIIDGKLSYPNSALMAVSGDASTFSNIPTRSYDLFGRIVQVPSNYDPVARTYTGVWDGSFKPSWSDNPAWCFYDLVTHPRYGLGTLVTAAQVDKWSLYRIAQYCDQLVPNGLGGQEPRFTCNLFLQTAADAYKVLSDLASLFRGLSYWANGSITANADMPVDPAYLYTAANVIDGKFTYQSSARKTRYTTALVTWNNPANQYRSDVEYVQHSAGMLRYGIQPVQLTAFGCTSRGQAQRHGQWVLNTAQLETETVTFAVGLDGLLAAPGQIIRIQDPARAGKRQAGRIHAATATAVTVDKAPDAVAVGDSLTCMLPTGVSETHAITAIAGAVLSVASPGFSVAPDAESAWVTESTTLAAQQFRVVTVTEDKSNKDQFSFTITAVQNSPAKYGVTDNSALIQPPPISALPATIQAPVASVTVSENSVIAQGAAQNVVTISWPAAAGADTYQVQWRRDNGQWIDAGGTAGLNVDVQGVYTGTYVAQVRAVSANGIVSLPTLSTATAVVGKTVPPAPPTLTATGGQLQIVLNWVWPTGVNVDDTSYTEVWVSPTSTMADGASVGSVAYAGTTYTISGLLPQQTRYAWVRLVDKSGNVGPWSLPANAVGGTAADLFKPLQDQITATQGNVDSALAQVQQEVTDRTAAVSAEANARATAILNEQNARTAAITAEQQTRQTADQSLATQISLVSAGSGEQFDSAKIWYFDSDLESWGGNPAAPTIVDGWMHPANGAGSSFVWSPGGLGIDGSSYRFVKVRIKKVGNPTWVGKLYWRKPGDPNFTGAQMASLPLPSFDADGVTAIAWQDIPWWPNTIDMIRLDITNTQTDTDYFLIDWVAIGRPTPGAGVALVQQETSARVLADSQEATQRTTLATQMRGAYTGTDVASLTSGLVYSEAQARSGADGALASRASALEARMPAGNGSVATTASVTDEATARAQADTAEATARQALASQVNDPSTGLATRASVASLNTTNSNVNALAGTVTAQGQSITAVQGALAGKADTSALQTLQTTVTGQGNAITANGQSITAVQGVIPGSASNSNPLATSAALNSLSGTVSQQGSQITANQNAITGVQGNVGAVNSRVDNEISARQSGDAANASSIATVQSKIATGKNLLQNSAFTVDGYWDNGWGQVSAAWAYDFNSPSFTPRGVHTYGAQPAGTPSGAWTYKSSKVVPILAGRYYMASLYHSAQRTNGYCGLLFYDKNMSLIADTRSAPDTSTPTDWNIPGQYTRLVNLQLAPSNAVYAQVYYTCAGTGGDPFAQFFWPMLEEASAGQAAPSPWTEGSATMQATASATQSLTAGTNINGTSYAAATTMVDANGRIGGTRLASNGSVSSFTVVADQFAVVAPNGGARTEYSDGSWKVYADDSGVPVIQLGKLS